MTKPIYATQVKIGEDFIDFGIGQPAMDILPLDIMRQAAEHRLTQGDKLILNYGNETGDGRFLHSLADFLTRGYGYPVAADSLFLTSSASQALDMLCTLFTKPGDTIFVEEPTYFLALLIFGNHDLNVVSLPVDDQGLQIDALEAALAAHQPRFIYTIPTFHNPTTVNLSQARREKLIGLSQEHQFLILADEVYQLLHYTAVPPKPFAAYIEHDTVISIGTFSKILAPGLRLGWLQAAPKLLERFKEFGVVESGGSLNHFTSSLVQSVLELGLQDDYLAFLKQAYQSRIEVMEAGLQAELSDMLTWTKPDGGFFFWLRLSAGSDAVALRAVARQHKTGFQPGSAFSSQESLGDYIRLSFAFYDEEKIGEGIRRLSVALRRNV
ncbi:MAG: PLP-dependent aminotransferase family protein [Chloroflexota bacterium]